MGKNKIFRVGIVGLTPGQSWAYYTHLPAIKEHTDKYVAAAVANRNQASSLAAAKAENIPLAFENADAMISSDDIDIVAVTVRVPAHRDIVKKAIEAGKTIYCEWPLGKNLAETEELAALAKESGSKAFIGMQALAHPAILHLKTLIDKGCIGEILSHSITGYGRIWGAEITDESEDLYLLDKHNGATMLTITAAHTLAAIQYVFGKISDLTSLITTRRNKVYSREREEYVEMTSPDQVGIQAILGDKSVLSLHYRGGTAPDGNGFQWDINGTKGIIRLTATTGSIQAEELKMEICPEGKDSFEKVEIPTEMLKLFPGEYVPGNVARMYEFIYDDLINGTHRAPGFDEALELHRLIDRIEKASIV